MKIKASVAAFAALLLSIAGIKSLAGRPVAPAAPPAAAPQGQALKVIASDRDVVVYAVQYEGRACLVASARIGNGISINCLR